MKGMRRYWLAFVSGLIASLPPCMILIAWSGDPEMPDIGYALLAIPPIGLFACGLLFRWWDWGLALVFCGSFCCAMAIMSLCVSRNISSAFGWILLAMLISALAFAGWALARGVRLLARRDWL